MDLDSASTIANKKRTAPDTDPSTEDSDFPAEDTAPRVLYRHNHRRRNVAIETWGLDPLDSPSSPEDTPPRSDADIPSSIEDDSPEHRPEKRPFNVYKAILRHNNLFFQFALRLPYSTMINLYAIDKEFHYRLNKYSLSLIHDYARYHAPLAGHIFSWTLYPQVCISDPMLRPMDDREWLARDVPGFRWIGMIIWRQKIVRSILTMLSMEGHRVPAACEGALMKFWCLMEMNTTKMRLLFLQDKNIWTAADIVHFQLLLMKLDMRFTDPVLGNGAGQLAPLLLGQKSLITLWKILSGNEKLNYDKTCDMIVKTYRLEDLDTDENPWLDDVFDVVPGGPRRGGLLARENWHPDGAKMDHVVDMVITEGIRRELHVQQYYIDFVLYGFVDEKTGKNVPVPTQLREEKHVRTPSEGWPEKKVREDVIKELDERFGVISGGQEDAMDLDEPEGPVDLSTLAMN